MLRKRERMEFLLLHVLELCDATIKILQVLWPTYPFGIKPFLNLVEDGLVNGLGLAVALRVSRSRFGQSYLPLFA